MIKIILTQKMRQYNVWKSMIQSKIAWYDMRKDNEGNVRSETSGNMDRWKA